MGVISPGAKVLFQRSELIPNAFPFPTPDLQHSIENQLRIAQETISNIEFFGRITGKFFTGAQVLIDVYQKLKAS